MTKVGLLLLGYSRPELLEERIRELSELNSQKLDILISIDKYEGPNQEFIERSFSRIEEEFSELLWIKNSKRFGLANHLTMRLSECFQNYDIMMIIEDDVSTSPSSINSLASILQSDQSEGFFTAGLFGALPNGTPTRNQWRFTRYFSAWGWGITKQIWPLYDLEIVSKLGRGKIKQSKNWRHLNATQQRRWDRRFAVVEDNPTLTWDFQMQFISWLEGLDHLLPTIRLSENVGFGDDRATNTKGSRPRWYRGKMSTVSHIQPHDIAGKLVTRTSSLIDSYTWIGDRKIFDRKRNK